MPHYPHLQLLGEILQEAALISAPQLEVVLRDQQSYQLPLGEILHLRGWLNQETADFFVEQWSCLLNSSSRHPLGYYFQLASLLETEQINAILQEQKQTVQKVWISRQKVEIPAVSRIAFRDGLESFDENDFSSFSPLQKVAAGLEADRVVVAQRVLERHQLKRF